MADEGDGSQSQSQSQSKIIFKNLETLELRCLKNLTVFCSIASCRIEFPSLNEVVVEQCPKMKIFSQGTLSSPKLKQVYVTDDGDKEFWTENLNTTIKQMYEEMVGFSGMEVLQLSEFPQLKEVWHNQLPIQLFGNLNKLVIDDCPFTPNSVPSNLLPFLDKLETLEVRNCNAVATAVEWPNANGLVGHLSNLTSLTVCGCEKMQQVVSLELENVQSREDITFNKLESLKLICLPSLVSFCSAEHSFAFPSLTQVIVQKCPKMQVFSHGVSSTLKLKTLQVTEEDDEGRWNGNLNATIQEMFKETNANAEESNLPSISELNL